MNIDEFWQLIDKTRIESGDNPTQQARLLEDALAKMPVEEIIEFQNIRNLLQNQAFQKSLQNAAHIIGEGCGEDGFMDFRTWLIGQGRELFEKAIQNPETLADAVSLDERHDTQAEDLLYVANVAHQRKTGDFIYDSDIIHKMLAHVQSE